ncbi:hypothetical protein [Arthrobacter woluwensis]|uniref:hypothetical protein n=1 Tax=Arthrobacter woluwensis TaxID=156980 RepID=UPI000942BC8D|nr:hypothetical protein [Arthrobacter woluwensis]
MKKSFDDGEAPKFANPILTTFAAVGAAAGKASREVKGGIKAMKAAYEDGGSDVTSSGFAGVLERIGISLRAGKDGVDAFFKAFQTGTQDFSKSGFAGFMSDFGSKIKGIFDAIGIHSGR